MSKHETQTEEILVDLSKVVAAHRDVDGPVTLNFAQGGDVFLRKEAAEQALRDLKAYWASRDDVVMKTYINVYTPEEYDELDSYLKGE